MTRYTVISQETHKGRFWKPNTSYTLFGKEQVLPIVADELHAATINLPLCFVPDDDQFNLVALTSLGSDKNVFIDHDGKWLGAYKPAIIRTYPFRMLPTEKEGQLALCFDETSGLMSSDEQDQAFFDEDGTPTEVVQGLMEILGKVEKSRIETAKMANLLNELGLLVPWKLKVRLDSGEQEIKGLYKIDEDKLIALDDKQFLRLRHSNTLQLAYCQLISMQNIQLLGRIPQFVARRDAQNKAAGLALDLDFLNDDGGNIDFGKLN